MPRTAYREAWTPFGGGIYFLADADGKDEINFFDLTTKQVRPVHIPDRQAPNRMGAICISSDGR